MAKKAAKSGAGVIVVSRKDLSKMVSRKTAATAGMKAALAKAKSR